MVPMATWAYTWFSGPGDVVYDSRFPGLGWPKSHGHLLLYYGQQL